MTNKQTLPSSTSDSSAFGAAPAADNLIDGGKVMSIFDHLAELRTRLVKSLAWIMVIFIVCFFYADKIMGFLKIPLEIAMPNQENVLHFTGPLDVFMVNMKVAFLTALVTSCPIWLFQFWKFFEPALYPRERKYVMPFAAVSVALFFAGISFCFFIMLPMAMTWMISLGSEVGTPMITVTDYVSLIIVMIFGFGFVFELPVILVLLAMLDIINAETLTEHRRIIVVAILIIAAIFTPPDPISQLCLAIPMYGMFEGAIVAIRMIKKKKTES